MAQEESLPLRFTSGQCKLSYAFTVILIRWFYNWKDTSGMLSLESSPLSNWTRARGPLLVPNADADRDSGMCVSLCSILLWDHVPLSLLVRLWNAGSSHFPHSLNKFLLVVIPAMENKELKSVSVCVCAHVHVSPHTSIWSRVCLQVWG